MSAPTRRRWSSPSPHLSDRMVIVGVVTITGLPVAQFPNIVPPEIQLQASYVGADAQTLEQSVATPIRSDGDRGSRDNHRPAGGAISEYRTAGDSTASLVCRRRRADAGAVRRHTYQIGW